VNVTFKFVGMLVILLIGVVIGLETAERGLYRVYGPPQEAPQPYYITKVDQGKVEKAPVVAPPRTAPEPPVNYVGEVGSALGQIVKDGAKAAFRWLASLFKA
jgi:hypothetical protein